MTKYKKYQTCVFIGRLAPMHLGHEHIIRRGLEEANEIIIVLGSSFAARSPRTPFTFQERRDMIKSVFPQNNVKVVPVSDYPYDDTRWVAAVQSAVYSSMAFTPDPMKIALIGHQKDETSYYLNLFKSWDSISVPNLNGYNSTNIRNFIFTDYEGTEDHAIRDSMSTIAYEKMAEILDSSDFDDVLADYGSIVEYREKWQVAPFPPTFVTGDAVLTQSGSILLIKRAAFPFKNKWALPGGYLNQKETILGGVIRELREETRVKVPEKVLRGSIKDSRIFDHPNRDPRGRTITHAYHIDLGFPPEGLPKVKGMDDAKEARWFQLAELRQDQMAFDHWHIISHFLKL